MYVELYKIIEIECLVVLILFLFVSLHYVSFFTIFIYGAGGAAPEEESPPAPFLLPRPLFLSFFPPPPPSPSPPPAPGSFSLPPRCLEGSGTALSILSLLSLSFLLLSLFLGSPPSPFSFLPLPAFSGGPLLPLFSSPPPPLPPQIPPQTTYLLHPRRLSASGFLRPAQPQAQQW